MGFLAGFLGVIPPGPLGVTCLRKSLQGQRRDATRVALGGASVDTLICALIGFGLGWILEKVVTNPWVKGTLALFLVGYGAKLLFVDARRDAERIDPGPSRLGFIPAPASAPAAEGRLRLPVLTGLLQGAANPALFLNWTLFISFLVGHRLFVPTAGGIGGDRARGIRLSTRLGVTWAGILVLAAIAQTVVYLQTRNETVEEADASYQMIAKAIEVGQTQIGPQGWKDPKVLADYTAALGVRGLRDIKVVDESGKPVFPEPPAAASVKKKPRKPEMPKDVVISGFIGAGPTNRSLVVPIVIDGKLRGHVEIAYNLENIRAQLADNFRRRLFALLGVFALGLAVMLVLTRNATRPLDELADGAAQVAEGRLDVTVPVDRDDEIGRLASTFNHMTERLRERQELEVRLAGAEKRAEIAHLAPGLAHEIKNPLNALSLGLDVLRRRHRPADETAAGEYGARIEALREEISRSEERRV